MSSIGPQLPPHLSKRKRDDGEVADSPPNSPPSKAPRPNKDEISLDNDSDSDDGYGPGAASIGPSMPPQPQPSTNNNNNNDEIALDDGSDDDDTGPAPPPSTTTAPKRVMGPAPPPAALSERPPHPPDSDSDSDSDYGPALPGSSSHLKNASSFPNQSSSATAEPEVPKRDDWMLAPPTANTGYQERDPTKIKARKFASGGARPLADKSGGVSAIWTETPEEKAKRLKDAVLGRGKADDSNGSAQQKRGGSKQQQQHQDDKIRTFTEAIRGKSLYEEHQAAKKAGKIPANAGGAKKGSTSQQGGNDDEEDDDPSKRAFDREKDMAVGGKITASQRKDLVNRASDFGGRFQKGNYL